MRRDHVTADLLEALELLLAFVDEFRGGTDGPVFDDARLAISKARTHDDDVRCVALGVLALAIGTQTKLPAAVTGTLERIAYAEGYVST